MIRKGSVAWRRWSIERGYIASCPNRYCRGRAQVWLRDGAKREFPFWVQCTSGTYCPPSRQFRTPREAIRHWNQGGRE